MDGESRREKRRRPPGSTAAAAAASVRFHSLSRASGDLRAWGGHPIRCFRSTTDRERDRDRRATLVGNSCLIASVVCPGEQRSSLSLSLLLAAYHRLSSSVFALSNIGSLQPVERGGAPAGNDRRPPF
uniref:Uncharacterized protein n=1 Tax=Plectus sambesii TaxID=2011161 RepID=A0A914W338_9BILA